MISKPSCHCPDARVSFCSVSRLRTRATTRRARCGLQTCLLPTPHVVFIHLQKVNLWPTVFENQKVGGEKKIPNSGFPGEMAELATWAAFLHGNSRLEPKCGCCPSHHYSQVPPPRRGECQLLFQYLQRAVYLFPCVC